MPSHNQLTERVAATLKRHAEERCHFEERHAKELHELTHFGMSADDCEAVQPAIPSLVQLLKLSGGASVAASALLTLSRTSDTALDAIREAGAIPALVALLHAGAESEAAERAADALWFLALDNPTNQDAIREAGAIPALVALLHAGAESEAAKSAAGVLWNLADDNRTNQDAIREAGAIPLLVALLHAGAESKAAENAAGALKNLAAYNPTNKDAVRESKSRVEDAILAAVANAAAPLHAFSSLQRKLRSVATARLQRAEAGETADALEAALAMAAAVGAADEAVTERVRSRLDEVQTAAARRARRESVGLNVPLPADFTCPITYDKMKDPVVASDGHSYERSSIEEILRGPHPISPLTRAMLGTALVPNLNLRRRIEDYEAELDRMAEKMAARLATAVAEAESAANAKEAAANAKEAAANAKEAAANAEIEALRQQLADAKKRARMEDDHAEDQDPPAPKRRAPSRRSSGSGAGGRA